MNPTWCNFIPDGLWCVSHGHPSRCSPTCIHDLSPTLVLYLALYHTLVVLIDSMMISVMHEWIDTMHSNDSLANESSNPLQKLDIRRRKKALSSLSLYLT